MPPGSRITQDAIAARYGTSRSPVREALRELAAEGLVTIVPDVGARVAPLDGDELVEAYLMREALEPIAVARSAANATPEHLAQMRAALERSEISAAQGDMEAYLEADREFHHMTFQLNDMPRLMRAIEGLWNTIDRHRAITSLVAARQDVGGIEHRRRIAQQFARPFDRDRLQERLRRQPRPPLEDVLEVRGGEAEVLGDRFDRRLLAVTGRDELDRALDGQVIRAGGRGGGNIEHGRSP